MTATGRTARPVVPAIGFGVAVLLIVAAITAPRFFHWDVHVGTFPPLLADPHPHIGPGTVPALVIGALVIAFGRRAAERSPWRLLLAASFVVGIAWIVSLATVSGLIGIARVLDSRSQYLRPAREVTDIGAMLHGFIARIPIDAPDHWPVHVAGHPPGIFLFYVLLVRIGLGSGLAAGLVSIAIAATAPAAVLICVRRLGSEPSARLAAPFLVVGPAAVWIGVSADAVFTAVAAWGLCCLAVAATARRRSVRIVLAVAAGGLLGLCVFLSYGLLLLGLLAVAVLIAARTSQPLPVALGAALLVALAFAAAGFAWWQAYPVLIHRYWAGIATRRPALYWVWADLAVLAISAGPVVGAGVAVTLTRLRELRLRTETRGVVLLTVAAVAIIGLADASGLSKSEVERIWLPFVPWLLLGTALLSPRWRRWGLALSVVLGLALEHLLHTAW